MRILYLEDDPHDAELVEATLEVEGIASEIVRVDNREDFLSRLDNKNFDLILADYTLPMFDGISALKLAQEVCPEIPFIFVSGTLNEELAIEALKLGAIDYVFKTRLSRIAPSIRRALRESADRVHRKLAEDGLRRSEAYLAEAQSLSHTGSFGWRISSGRIFWSAETFRIFDFESTSEPTLERVFERVHPEDLPFLHDVIDSVIQQRLPEANFEHRILMPDGRVKYLRVVGRLSTQENSADQEFVGAVTDITDRKLAELELQQLIDLVPQVILVFGADGKYLYANRIAREYTGLTLEQYLSIDVIDRVVHPNDIEATRRAREKGFSKPEPFENEARVEGADGLYRWFLFRYNPLVEHGAIKRWYTTGTEIESRKQEEERVRRENVRLEERTRIAQELHDTLLQSFLGASIQLGAAVDELPDESAVKPSLDRILHLMEQGIEEGRKTIQGLRSSDPGTSDLIEALSGVSQELAVNPDVDFRFSLNGEQRPLHATVRHEIYRIGREALINAFRHSKARHVEFELEYSDAQLRMLVRDDGCGIDPEVLRSGRSGHWGLAGMRERAHKVGGLLTIASSAAKGTEILLVIPSEVAFQENSGFEVCSKAELTD